MIKNEQINLYDLMMCITKAIDLISPNVSNHHIKVSYIAYMISREIGLSVEQQNEIVMAGLLHDIGAFSLKDRLDMLKFEVENQHIHAEKGYLLLKIFKPFSKIANIVRYHHNFWEEEKNLTNIQIPIESHILHIADRIAISINKNDDILNQIETIKEKIKMQKGKMFNPDLVEAFIKLSANEYFWFDIVSDDLDLILSFRVKLGNIDTNTEDFMDLAKLFSHIIDFRSSFTATHSAGVTASAEAIAKKIGFSEKECHLVKVAGYLHDLGKLMVPVEILEKPGALTKEEFNIIKRHTYFTYRILERIEAFEDINKWAAYHHEHLDGKGYPFRIKNEDIPLISRIMAVCDVFTALTEDRPYRKGMTIDKTKQILNDMTKNKKLDEKIVILLNCNFEEINEIRRIAQEKAIKEYAEFRN